MTVLFSQDVLVCYKLFRQPVREAKSEIRDCKGRAAAGRSWPASNASGLCCRQIFSSSQVVCDSKGQTPMKCYPHVRFIPQSRPPSRQAKAAGVACTRVELTEGDMTRAGLGLRHMCCATYAPPRGRLFSCSRVGGTDGDALLCTAPKFQLAGGIAQDFDTPVCTTTIYSPPCLATRVSPRVCRRSPASNLKQSNTTSPPKTTNRSGRHGGRTSRPFSRSSSSSIRQIRGHIRTSMPFRSPKTWRRRSACLLMLSRRCADDRRTRIIARETCWLA